MQRFFFFFFIHFTERKRRVYDQYGKDGLMGHNERHHRSRRNEYEDLDYGFVFRSPDEVFREFFGVNSPFADLFGGSELKLLFSLKKCFQQIQGGFDSLGNGQKICTNVQSLTGFFF